MCLKKEPPDVCWPQNSRAEHSRPRGSEVCVLFAEASEGLLSFKGLPPLAAPAEGLHNQSLAAAAGWSPGLCSCPLHRGLCRASLSPYTVDESHSELAQHAEPRALRCPPGPCSPILG